MTSIRRKLALVSHLKLLNGATSGDEKPIAGYMYDEICKITFISVATCAELEDELLSRLKNKSPHTKYKVLKILKHLVEKGHEGFKQDLQRRTEPIRDCISFRGKQDQMHGDTFNKKVRQSAEELMQAMFDTSTDGPRAPPGKGPSVIKSSATSIGSATSSGSGGGGHVGGSGSGIVVGEADGLHLGTGDGPLARSGKLVGFGNQSTQPEKTTLASRMKEKASALKDKAISTAGKLKDAYNERRGVAGGDGHGGAGSYQSGSYQSNISSDLSSTSVGMSGGGYQPPTMASGTSRFQDHKQLGSDSGYEARLVDEITMPAGVRAAPPKSVLAGFVAKCESLDCYKVAGLLEEKLDSGEPDKTKIRALYVIEALLQASIPGVHDCFAPLREAVQVLQSASHSTVREMSIRVLGVMDSGGASTASPIKAPPVASAAPATSLLDLNDPAPQPESDSTGSTTGGMFAGMDIATSSSSATSTAAGGGMFAGMEVASEPQVQSQGGSGMFAGMSIAGGSSSISGTNENEKSSNGGSGSSSMFAGMEVASGNQESAPVPAVMDSTTSLLGGLDLSPQPESSTQAASAVNNSNSATGDLLGDLFGSAGGTASLVAGGGTSSIEPTSQPPTLSQPTAVMGQQPMSMMNMQQQPMMNMQQQSMMGMQPQQPMMGMQQQPMMGMQQQSMMGMQQQPMMGMQQQPMMGMQPMMMMMQPPGGMTMPMTAGMASSASFPMSGATGSTATSSAAPAGNSFGFVKSQKAAGSDPFGFISDTVSKETKK